MIYTKDTFNTDGTYSCKEQGFLIVGVPKCTCDASEYWIDYVIGTSNISLRLGPNNTTLSRSGYFYITLNDTKYIYKITQEATTEPIDEDPSIFEAKANCYHFPSSGGICIVTLNCLHIAKHQLPNSLGLDYTCEGDVYTITIDSSETGNIYKLLFVGKDTSGNIKYANVQLTQDANSISYTLTAVPDTLYYTSNSESHTLTITSTKNDNGTTENLGWSITDLPDWIDLSNQTDTSITLTTNKALTKTTGGNAVITLEESGRTANVALIYTASSTPDITTKYAYTGCSNTLPTSLSEIQTGYNNGTYSRYNLSSPTNDEIGPQSGGNLPYVWIAIPSNFYLLTALDDEDGSFSQAFTNNKTAIDSNYTIYYIYDSGRWNSDQSWKFTESSNKGTGEFTVDYKTWDKVIFKSVTVNWGDILEDVPTSYTINGTTYTITSWIVNPKGKTIVADTKFVVKESVEDSASEAKTSSVLSATHTDDDF